MVPLRDGRPDFDSWQVQRIFLIATILTLVLLLFI
jgi:hypothetical protein